MSKYPSGHTASAIYEGSSGNPYLEAMPDILSPEQFAKAVASYPPMTSIYFIGTPVAEELFVSQEHLKRRTRGIRLAPFKPDGVYLNFVHKIWPYQYTAQAAPLTTSITNKLYDCSGGIPAYIVKIFGESQAQSLIQGRSCIDEKVIQRAVELLAIKVPRTYASGTHISDFEIGMDTPAPPLEQEEVPRQYANKRGRKAAQRDDGDLLVAYNNGVNLEAHLKDNGYLEVDYHGQPKDALGT